MRENCEVIKALRETKKGKLVYDRHRLSDKGAKAFLDGIVSQITCLSVIPCSSLEKDSQDEKLETLSPDTGKSSASLNTEEKPVSSLSSPSSSPPLFLSPIKALQNLCDESDSSHVNLSILEYEEERAQKVKDAVEAKRSSVEMQYELIHKEVEQQLQLLFRRSQLETQRRSLELKHEVETQLKEMKEREQKLKEHHKTHAKRLSAKMKEAELRQKQLELQQQKRLNEQRERWQQLTEYQMELHNIVQQTIESFQSCKYHKYLQTPPTEWLEKLRKLVDTIDQLVVNNQGMDISNDTLNIAQQLLEKVKSIFQEVTSDIQGAKAMNEREIEVAESVVSEVKVDEAIDIASSSTSITTVCIDNISTDENTENVSSPEEKDLHSTVPDSPSFKEYQRLIEKLSQWQQAYQPLMSVELKKYRFDLQKAVNLPINAISPASGTHLRDKLQRLESLISGVPVDIGGKRVKSTDHPLAKAFCKDLMAKKFVMQGESQVASRFDSAFAIATVIVGIWCSFPDIGDLFLAYLYEKCPYLVPYYVPRDQNESKEDHLKRLGYTCVDGVLEKQDKFLKRMSGITRLYAAVIQSSIPPGCKGPHPHGIEHGWKWLTQILNQEPKPDITATLLLDFLEVTGHSMQKMYGRQFQKLLHALCKDYFPKIQKITPTGCGGPVTRLETFLHSAIKRGRIPPPDGILSNYFWSAS